MPDAERGARRKVAHFVALQVGVSMRCRFVKAEFERGSGLLRLSQAKF